MAAGVVTATGLVDAGRIDLIGARVSDQDAVVELVLRINVNGHTADVILYRQLHPV